MLSTHAYYYIPGKTGQQAKTRMKLQYSKNTILEKNNFPLYWLGFC